MSKLRYNRTFKRGILTILFCILLFGSVVVFAIVAKVQFNALVADMKTVEATVVNIDYNVHVKGPDEQELYVTYVVDGETYTRGLKTDTTFSFSAGVGAHYSVGDTVEIFYAPHDPSVIAVSRSVYVGNYYMAIGIISLGLVLFAMYWMLKRSRTFLVTQEEYEREKDEIKRRKNARKKEKKLSRTEQRAEARRKHPVVCKITKVMLIVLSSVMGAFVLFILFGMLLNALGY